MTGALTLARLSYYLKAPKFLIDHVFNLTQRVILMSTTGIEAILQEKLRPIAHSPWPIWMSSALFMSTAGLKSAGLPPLYQRIGFPFIFVGAGYVLSTGDKRNGSGISTGASMAEPSITVLNMLCDAGTNSMVGNLLIFEWEKRAEGKDAIGVGVDRSGNGYLVAVWN